MWWEILCVLYVWVSLCARVCVSVWISNTEKMGTLGENYSENNIGAEDTVRTLCRVCQARSSAELTLVPLWTSGQILCQYEASGKLEPIISFPPPPAKPAKWDLLGLFWVCWRIIFPCAAVGNKTAQKSPAKLTWAEPNWRDSSLLQCSVIPDDMMVCLSPCVCLPHSLGVIFLFWTSESRLSYSCVWVYCLIF